MLSKNAVGVAQSPLRTTLNLAGACLLAGISFVCLHDMFWYISQAYRLNLTDLQHSPNSSGAWNNLLQWYAKNNKPACEFVSATEKELGKRKMAHIKNAVGYGVGAFVGGSLLGWHLSQNIVGK